MPNVCAAAATRATGFMQVMPVRTGRLWGLNVYTFVLKSKCRNNTCRISTSSSTPSGSLCDAALQLQTACCLHTAATSLQTSCLHWYMHGSMAMFWHWWLVNPTIRSKGKGGVTQTAVEVTQPVYPPHQFLPAHEARTNQSSCVNTVSAGPLNCDPTPFLYPFSHKIQCNTCHQ